MATGKLRVSVLELDGNMTMYDLKTLSVYDLIIRNSITVNGTLNVDGPFIIETRTSDPQSPENGRIWLRTDL